MMETYSSKGKRTASISIEHGMVKLMASKGQTIDGYRVSLANPRFFREGHVSNPTKIAGLLDEMLPELNGGDGQFKQVNAVVPGSMVAVSATAATGELRRGNNKSRRIK
ncbi:MAG: hypothetical protein V3S68_04945 [Dehalococcoidia bacterium]